MRDRASLFPRWETRGKVCGRRERKGGCDLLRTFTGAERPETIEPEIDRVRAARLKNGYRPWRQHSRTIPTTR